MSAAARRVRRVARLLAGGPGAGGRRGLRRGLAARAAEGEPKDGVSESAASFGFQTVPKAAKEGGRGSNPGPEGCKQSRVPLLPARTRKVARWAYANWGCGGCGGRQGWWARSFGGWRQSTT